MTPYHPLVETAAPPEGAFVIWPWPNNWSEPFTQRLEYKTAVLPSASSREQRRALREVPRETFIVNNLLEHPDSATALALLRAWKGKNWLVPGWHEMARTLAPAGQVLQLDRFSVRPGPALLGAEVVEVVSSSGTLAVSPSGSWPAGTELVPLYEALLDEDQTAEFVTAGVARLSVAFQVAGRPVSGYDARIGAVVPSGAVAEVLGPDGSVGYENGIMGPGGATVTGYRVNPDAAQSTIEMWLWVPSGITAPRQAVARAGGGESGNYLTLNSGSSLNITNWIGEVGASVPYFDAWFHVAFDRDSNGVVRSYVNGVPHSVGTGVGNVLTAPGPSVYSIFPSGFFANNVRFTGKVAGFRATGATRYGGSSFVPPTIEDAGYSDPFWDRTAVRIDGSPRDWGEFLEGPAYRQHLVPARHNWAASSPHTVSKGTDTLDPGTSGRHFRPADRHSALRWSAGLLLDDLPVFLSWFHVHRGAAVSFYACPPGQDVTVTAVAGAVATVPELRFFTAPAEVFTHMALRVAGEWEYRAISSIAGAAVTLASAPSGMPDAARLVTRARILGDAVELRYHTLGVAEVSLPLTTVVE